MQIFRYMAFIWEDYEKEQNRKHEGIAEGKAHGIVQTVKLMGGTMEMAAQQLVTLCDIDAEKSWETVKLYW